MLRYPLTPARCIDRGVEDKHTRVFKYTLMAAVLTSDVKLLNGVYFADSNAPDGNLLVEGKENVGTDERGESIRRRACVCTMVHVEHFEYKFRTVE